MESFSCTFCLATFTSENKRRHHQRSHRVVYKCLKCSQHFLQTEELQNHVAADHQVTVATQTDAKDILSTSNSYNKPQREAPGPFRRRQHYSEQRRRRRWQPAAGFNHPTPRREVQSRIATDDRSRDPLGLELLAPSKDIHFL